LSRYSGPPGGFFCEFSSTSGRFFKINAGIRTKPAMTGDLQRESCPKKEYFRTGLVRISPKTEMIKD
jgi:hypothetical protein